MPHSWVVPKVFFSPGLELLFMAMFPLFLVDEPAVNLAGHTVASTQSTTEYELKYLFLLSYFSKFNPIQGKRVSTLPPITAAIQGLPQVKL